MISIEQITQAIKKWEMAINNLYHINGGDVFVDNVRIEEKQVLADVTIYTLYGESEMTTYYSCTYDIKFICERINRDRQAKNTNS